MKRVETFGSTSLAGLDEQVNAHLATLGGSHTEIQFHPGAPGRFFAMVIWEEEFPPLPEWMREAIVEAEDVEDLAETQAIDLPY